jgi:type III restriction enzyme
MKPQVNQISNRLSLRAPQRKALEILDRIAEIIPLEKGADVAKALEIIRSEYPNVTDFERDFPSVCFAIATGVGKTRLMGAFISYLYTTEGIRHFFVLAPNLTIYNKLIADFSPNTPKYVFQGLAEFATNPPEIITGDNYESGRGVRAANLFGDTGVHVNIFNISKINSEVRGGSTPRIKRLSEYIGESYFEYLSKLDDLVLLMDESHRYRASAGVKAINELKPILGLELTATPQVEKGAKKAEPFRNVIYSYPLAHALNDGYVKEPAVATRENFDPKNYDKEGLQRLKLEDGVRIHENTKVELEVYARQHELKIVKPFMLVVAEDTNHANTLLALMTDNSFFDGTYKGKVITVHSGLSGEEKDETVQQLLSVEDPANPTEIVIHVNMLKEGWDVTNLYTIVPLRAANSRTLVEQSIGRGLRLPYGKRTGVGAVDRLTIVAHDRFQEIVDDANRPDSSIRVVPVYIGRDVPDDRTRVVIVDSGASARINGSAAMSPTIPAQQPLFSSQREQEVANTVINVIREYERLPRSSDLRQAEIQKQIAEKVAVLIRPAQPELEGVGERVDVAAIVAKTIDLHIELSIDIPRIIVVPTGEVTSGYRDFDLDVSGIHLQPVAKDILIQHLHDQTQHRLVSGDGIVEEERLEDYLVRGLIDFNDVSYDDHADLLYKLSGQLVRHLQSYLAKEDDLRNVLQYHQKKLVDLIHTQMQKQYEEKATGYEAHVSKGFMALRQNAFTAEASETVRDFRNPVEDRLAIRGMLFGGFKKCCYGLQKFHSDSERRFSVVLENDSDVLKWFKPARGQFQIHYRRDEEYEPDFVVETKTAKFLCEPKRANEMEDTDVLDKAKAASLWCQNATQPGDKPWFYLLIPHDAISDNKTLGGLAAGNTYKG